MLPRYGVAAEEASVRSPALLQPKNLARGTDVFSYRNELLLNVDGPVGAFGDFIEHAGQAAAGEVAQTMNLDAGAQKLEHDFSYRSGVAFDLALELKPFAHRHDRHAMAPHVSVHQHGVNGWPSTTTPSPAPASSAP